MNPVRTGRNSGGGGRASAGAKRASVAIGFGSPSGDTGVTRRDVVIAVVDDEFVCRRFSQQGDGLRLQATLVWIQES